MAGTFSFGSINVRLGSDDPGAPGPRGDGEPFRLLLVGDFGGRAARGLLERGKALAARRPVRAGLDELDSCIARLAPEVHLTDLPGGLPPLSIRFHELDDFHPDRLVASVPLLRRLCDEEEERKEEGERSRESRAVALRTNLLDRILAGDTGGEPEDEPEPSAGGPGAAELLRAILHDPGFAALEAAWRGVDFLVRRLDTDGPLTLHLLDLTRPELRADLLSTERLEETALWDLLVTRTVETPGAVPWSALALLGSFGETPEDLAVLGRLAKICRRAGTPVLSGASSRLLGCAALPEAPDPADWEPGADAPLEAAWKALRELPEARGLGLALPGLLLRLPYGRDTEPLEELDFSELTPEARHQEYLWGDPVLAPLLLLGLAFEADGREMRPGSEQEIDNLPLAFRDEDGSKQPVPCAGVLLTVKAAQRIIAAGLMPLLSMKGTDVVRLGVFQSIASPPAPLEGPWGT